ncbi:MAG: glycoside hydrolase family 3 C-terminal domain-containing protein [Bacteroidetes bacterium]|nr:glycoside hydrolase family 3 C-terminal domain-containing protein [Bacteroidota bacterium]
MSGTLIKMKAMSTILLATGVMAGCSAPNQDTRVADLLSRMTLEEKIGQMTQVTFDVIGKPEADNDGFPIDLAKLDTAILKYHVGSILNTPYNKAQDLETWNKMMTAVQDAAQKSRLKIPVIYGIDAIHGTTYTKGGTLFPQAINLAATFNTELAEKEGAITAVEMKASGMTWNFYPVLDVGRQPLWSRFWETYGEDPYLAGVLGAAYIRGHQGDDYSQPDKAPTCLKHYIGYSMPFNGKDRTPAHFGERLLRDVFLPPFQAGVLAGSPTVMLNSGEVDGMPGHANKHYLNTILRGELGFTGFTVSDWEDIKRLYTRDKVAASPEEAVKMAVMAGVDMSMVPYDFSFYTILLGLVRSGEVPESRIDEAVSRILKVKFDSGLFDNPYPNPDLKARFATAESREANRQAARESIVLAKNENNLLPLKKDTRLLITGPTANLLQVLNGGWTGTWQGDNEALLDQSNHTILEAFQEQSGGKITYAEGTTFQQAVNIGEAVKKAASADAILLCLGEKAYCETPGNLSSLDLDKAQKELAEAMFKTGKPVILLMLQGRPRVITELADQSRAVILGMLPGMEGAGAIADVVYGTYNPDGKLPFTYPKSVNGHSTYDYKPLEVYDGQSPQWLYPFGHGLSYTTFETSALTVDKKEFRQGETVTVSVTVKNTGTVAGKESVLLYLQDEAALVSRPNRQLKAFAKVFLQPGESQTVTLILAPDAFQYTGPDYKPRTDPGTFRVMTGSLAETITLLN